METSNSENKPLNTSYKKLLWSIFKVLCILIRKFEELLKPGTKNIVLKINCLFKKTTFG